MLLRLSEEEFALARTRAELAGLAVGAWIGEAVLDAAHGEHRAVGLPDLLRLHADVTLVAGLLDNSERADQVAELLGRLDRAIDSAVLAAGTAR